MERAVIQPAGPIDTPGQPLDASLVWQVLDVANVGLLVTDVQRRIVYVNAAFSQATGYSQAEVLGRNCSILQGPATDPADVAYMRDALDRGEPFERVVLNYRKDGTPLWYRLRVQPMYVDNTLQYFVGVQEDYSEARDAQRELERLAYHDGLTGLGNRRAFDLHLRQLVIDSNPADLVLMDLNDFKQVNDRYGHQAGDALLRRVAACLEHASQHEGAAFRIGGDEFALLLPTDSVSTFSAGQRVLASLVTADGEQIHGATGSARFPEEARDVESLLRLADRRLYANKALKKGARSTGQH